MEGQANSANLKKNWKIYTDPVLPEEEAKKLDGILVTRKVETVLDTGYIHAPYIPLQVSPSFGIEADKPKAPKSPLEEFVEEVFKEEVEAGHIKPLPREISAALDEFHLRKGLRTRYQKQLINPNYYGTVNVENL